MLCLLLAHALSFHLSIDFGSQFVKSSITTLKENPEIAVNSDSKELIPSYIAINSLPNSNISSLESLSLKDIMHLKPIFGDKAIELMSHRPWLGSAFLSSYIGLLKNESNRIANNLFVNVTAWNLSISELSTLFLELYINAISHDKIIHSVSVVVPAIYTVPQRREVESIIRESGFNFQSIIDDVEAISSIYLIKKSQIFSQSPKTVLFIDIGATSIKSYCIKFELATNKVPQAIELSYVYLNEQGGAYLTRSLVYLIISKYNISDLSNAEYQRLFNAAEYIKIKLSSLLLVSYVVENIHNESLKIKIARYELESISKSLIEQTIETAKNASKNINFNNIEIIGGTSRIPIISFSIQNAFDVNYLGNSLDSNYSLCIGAGYNSQIKNGINNISQSQIQNTYSPYNVNLKLDNNRIFTICKQNGRCIDEINITDTTTQFELIYENLNTSLLKTNSFGYKVKMIPNTSLLIKFSKSTPIYPVSALMCNYQDDSCEHIYLEQLDPINETSDVFKKLLSARLQVQKIDKARNKLEILALRVIKEINENETFRKYSNSDQRYLIKTTANEALKLIRDNFDSITDDKNLTNYYNIIKNETDYIYNKIKLNDDRSLTRNIFLMNHTLCFAQQKLSKWRIDCPKRYADDVIEFSNVVEKAEKWFLKAAEEVKNSPNYADRKVSSKDFEENSKRLNQEIIRMLNIMPNDTEKNDDNNNKKEKDDKGETETKSDDAVSNLIDYLVNNLADDFKKGLNDFYKDFIKGLEKDLKELSENDLFKNLNDWLESTPRPDYNHDL